MSYTRTAVLPVTLDSVNKFAVSPGFATDGRLLVSNYGKYPTFTAANFKLFGGGVSASALAFPTGSYAPALYGSKSSVNYRLPRVREVLKKPEIQVKSDHVGEVNVSSKIELGGTEIVPDNDFSKKV